MSDQFKCAHCNEKFNSEVALSQHSNAKHYDLKVDKNGLLWQSESSKE
ncbi:MAG: hypothetical protein AABW90_00415 [Nanoarchaeota archaeon]